MSAIRTKLSFVDTGLKAALPRTIALEGSAINFAKNGLQMSNTQAGADYILSALLPRLEELKPGRLNELSLGIKADKEAIIQTGRMNAEIEQVFLSVEDILRSAPD